MVRCVNGVNNINVLSQVPNNLPLSSPLKNNTPSPQQQVHSVPFRATDVSLLSVRTNLSSKDEVEKFNEISANLDRKHKKLLKQMLNSGILLNNASDNRTSVLDNLYSILKTPRAAGLDNRDILKSAVMTLGYPFSVNQKLGDIPNSYRSQFINAVMNDKSLDINTFKEANDKLNDLHSSTCPTACVEFSLASKQPAEFARMVNDLTSPNLQTDKIISLKNLCKDKNDAIWLLDAFKVPYEFIGNDKARLTLKPDKDVLLRASMQTKYQNGLERNAMDVIIQSTFMNVASQQTYNSVVDERQGEFSQENTGLVEFEKTFLESIVQDKSTTSMVYQKINDNMEVTGYECDFKTTEQQIIDTLKRNQNVIIGITYFEKDKDIPDKSVPQNTIAGGHEITIVGYKKAKNGDTIFICQDSDDDVNMPVMYPASWLLPRLHHAGLPDDIAERTMPAEETQMRA